MNISQAIKSVIDILGLNLNNLCGITTVGAPAMVGKMNGEVSLIEKEMRNAGIERQLLRTHSLVRKIPADAGCMLVVVMIVSFVCAGGLYHRQFQHMLKEMENQYGDLLYYCEVRWLSRGAMLQGFSQLRVELANFLREKGMNVLELSDEIWIKDFSFLVDITNHLNMLNLKLQGRNQFINVLCDHIYAFEVKLQLWKLQLKETNCIHFLHFAPTNHVMFLVTPNSYLVLKTNLTLDSEIWRSIVSILATSQQYLMSKFVTPQKIYKWN